MRSRYHLFWFSRESANIAIPFPLTGESGSLTCLETAFCSLLGSVLSCRGRRRAFSRGPSLCVLFPALLFSVSAFILKVFENSQETFFKKFLERIRGSTPVSRFFDSDCISVKESGKNFCQKFLKILKKLFSKSFLSGVRGSAPRSPITSPRRAYLRRWEAARIPLR